MTALITAPNLARPDEVYARLLAAHVDLDEQASAAFNARLILILMNHIGDDDVIADALALAADTAPEIA